MKLNCLGHEAFHRQFSRQAKLNTNSHSLIASRMADGDGHEVEEGGPGMLYFPFMQMEALLDKLKALGYDQQFCKKLKLRPLNKVYFAIQSNAGEQFYYFTSLAAWLLRLAGRQVQQPQEDDDPNATISMILDELRSFSHPVDFPPNKLKAGGGEQVLYVLTKLADEAIRATNYFWKPPVYSSEGNDDREVIDDDEDLELQARDDEQGQQGGADSDYEDEGTQLDLLALQRRKEAGGGDNAASAEVEKLDDIMESTTDANDWRMEVDRVMVQLKVTIRSDNKDWRVHRQQMLAQQGEIEKTLKDTKAQLDHLCDEITNTLEKIASREKYLNTQLESLMSEYRSLQNRLLQIKEQYRMGSSGLNERAKRLTDIQEELERVKQEMDERGSTMTDGSPLVRIKQAVSGIKKELVQIDVRCAVLEHSIMTVRVKDQGATAR